MTYKGWYAIKPKQPTNQLFTILSKSHSDYLPKVLGTLHILTYKPSLCKLRECLSGLTLISIWFTLLFFANLHFFPSISLHSPCPFSFLSVVLVLAVIREDRNQLVYFI